MWTQLVCTAILAHATFSVGAASGNTQSYPSKPIRLVDGFPPTGTTDYLGRLIGPKLAERFRQPVIVDNRPGAASNVAAGMVARANPDGHTLFMGLSIALASAPSLYSKLDYDPLKDLSYVSLVATGAYVLLVQPSMPAKSVSEFVAFASSQPTAVLYGSAGVGSPVHLATELLRIRTGTKLQHVPYKGGPPALAALIGGEVQFVFSSVPVSLPMIEAKRLKVLAVSGAKRLRLLPGIPTMAESGFPGFDVTTTYGILAPSGIPAPIVKLLNAEIRKIVQMDDIRRKFAEQALDAEGSTPEEFRAIVKAEIEKWARVIKDAHIPAN